MDGCIFCKIASKKIKSDVVFENEDIIAFSDAAPQAPVHILVVPKEHIERIEQVNDYSVISSVFEAVNRIALEKGLTKNGFRVVVNSGDHGGQAVPHLHFHLLGGRRMAWPPG
jgi:histidine triad (HIT) family protein